METFRGEELRQIQLFQSVDLDAIKGILDACTIRSLGAGEVLIAAGQDNRTVYFLLEGHVRIHLASLEDQPTAILGPGESVGEMSVVDHKPASAFVVAAEPVRLLAMEEEILWSLVHSSHAAASNLLIGLSHRLRHADAMISEGGREMEPDYRHHGTVDALTGLHNRFWLETILDRQVQRSTMGGLPLSVIMIDIDHFRTFNDHYGPSYGDRVLYAMALTLSGHLRPTEIIGRYGGDEFVVILPDIGLDVARDIGERLHRGVMDAVPVTPNGSSIPHPTISIGLATLKEGQKGRELLAEAEQALARTKSEGRNRIAE
jgi:diguanylate cyclase (GGDEF)-like protein